MTSRFTRGSFLHAVKRSKLAIARALSAARHNVKLLKPTGDAGMSRFATGIFAATCLVVVAGCKPTAEQAATSEKYDGALLALREQAQSQAVDPSMTTAAARLAAACGRLTLAQPATNAAVCTRLEAIRKIDPSIVVPPAAVAAERAAWDAYADEPDQQLLAGVLSENIETSRRALVAGIIAQHWRLWRAIGDKAKIIDAAVAASMGDEFKKRAPAEFALTAVDPNARAVFASRLEWEQTLLEAVGRPALDPLYEQTLADISSWRKRVDAANAFTGDRDALKTEIVGNADNKLWESALVNVAPTSVPDGLNEVVAAAGAPASQSAFDDFLTRAAALDLLRSQLAGARDGAPPPPLSPEAARQLVKDCRALTELDRSAADQICGGAYHALKFSLDLLDRTATGGGGAGSNPGAPPSTDPAGDPPQGLSAELQARLAPSPATAGATATDKAVPAADAQSVHVQALKARIGAISRSYAQASVHGYVEQVARLEAHLASIHEAMRIAYGDNLPERLRDSLALLEQADAQAALRETQRLQRIVARNLTLIPDAAEFKVAAGALEERTKALEKRLAAPPTKADLAAVVRKIDPDKAKALAKEMPPKVAPLAEKRVKSWSEKFKALPVRFDTWRGPRGPPENDPKFPRSQRVLAAIELLGRNPTDAVRAFSSLKAEHAEFYRDLDTANGKNWEFGQNKIQAWIVSLLSPPDLALAAASTKQAARVPEALQAAEGWRELIDATAQLQNAIDAEAKMRRATPGHPPGYPPKNLAAAVRVAERYSQEWDKRPALPIEQQVRFQTANLMYPDTTTMPPALRDEIRRIVNDVLDTEMAQLEALLATLYGSNNQGGLLDRAARSVEKLPDAEMAALIAGKQKAVRAAEIIAQRVAAAESRGYVRVDPKRWDRIVWWFGGFGRGPPPEAMNIKNGAPLPPVPGSGGAHFLFTSTELERNFVNLAAVIDDAERNLKVAESIGKRSVDLQPVGQQPGRATADRRNWKDGKYSFDGMRARPGTKTAHRYPEKQRNWDGFWQPDATNQKIPFDFNKYVKNFTNFQGVGGGIHFGEVAAPDAATAAAMQQGAALSYDDDSKTLTLRLHTGQAYVYGPVEPRVLKALYAYVTSRAGVNLAVTIGAAGAGELAGDENGLAVLLDPHFVDTRVGQDLYLADTIPWSLDSPSLPNGEKNEAADSFRLALDAYNQSKHRTADRIVALFGPGAADVYKTYALAVLFDDKASFGLADGRINLTLKMRYRYATSTVNVTSKGVIFERDGPGGKDGKRARDIDGLAAAANNHIDDIARVYPPLAQVQTYAALAAFLRWAACPQHVGQSCRRRDGLTIDFSALGRYALRDREATPTPDMDAKRAR